MAGYLSSRKLTNVKGRLKYISDEYRQENIIDYYNTTDSEFWKMLVKESHLRHKEVNARGKCCEARELIIGIPYELDVTAKQLCDIFKTKYNVECSCAIHQNNKKGIINKHCHLIFSERRKLAEPQVTEEKKASRTYYYNEKGIKCKKAEAVKIVKKGDLIQKGTTRYFSNKDDFFKSQKFVYDCKKLFLNNTFRLNWSLKNEKANKDLSQKHIGKNNPKVEYIKQNNALKRYTKNICTAGDIIRNTEEGTTLKDFKKKYEIDSFSTPTYEDNINKVFQFQDEMKLIFRNEVESKIKTHNKIVDDVEMLRVPSNNSVFRKTQEEIVEEYKTESKIEDISNKFHLIDFLRDTMTNIFKRLKKLVKIQDLLDIEDKNKIDVVQGKNDKLYIEESNRSREINQTNYKKEYNDEFDLEL